MTDMKPSLVTPDEDRSLTAEELATRLGVKVGTIYNWNASGKGPESFKLSNSLRAGVRWKLSKVIEWEASRPTSNHGAIQEAAEAEADKFWERSA